MKRLAFILLSSMLLISNCFALAGGRSSGLNVSISKITSAADNKENISLKLNDKEWICQPQSNTQDDNKNK